MYLPEMALTDMSSDMSGMDPYDSDAYNEHCIANKFDGCREAPEEQPPSTMKPLLLLFIIFCMFAIIGTVIVVLKWRKDKQRQGIDFATTHQPL